MNTGMALDDIEDATHQRLSTIWGETNATGEEYVMRRPVERYYPAGPDGSHEWIQDSVRADLGLPEGTRFRILSDGATEADIRAGRPPSYQVSVENEFGHLTPFIAVNTPANSVGMSPAPVRVNFEMSTERQQEMVENTLALQTENRTRKQLSEMIQTINQRALGELDMSDEDYEAVMQEAEGMVRRIRMSGNKSLIANLNIQLTQGLNMQAYDAFSRLREGGEE